MFVEVLKIKTKIMHSLYSEIKSKFPQYNWDDEPVQIEEDEDSFCLDVESLNDFERYNGSNTIVYNLDIEPEVEYSFESVEEVFCQVYTNDDGIIRSIYLNID